MSKDHVHYFGLKGKILLFTMAPFVLVIIVISLLAVQNKMQSERELVSNRIESYVNLLESGDLSFESIKQKEQLETLFNETVLSAELIRRDRSVVYTTGPSKHPFSEKLINKAFEGFIITHSKRDGTAVLLTLYPIIVKDTVVGVLHLELSFEKSNNSITRYILFVFFLDMSGIAVSFLLIQFLSRRIILNRLRDLTGLSSEISEGNLQRRLVVKSHDELGRLASTFNTMTDQLVERNRQLEDERRKVLDKVVESEREIARRRRVEEALQKAHGELELRVKDRTAELEAVNSELEAFAYSVSHDLRAPLRAINGFSQVLMAEYGDALDEQAQHYLQRVKAGTQNMGRLIDDLLDLSRVGRQAMNKKTMSVEDIARDVYESLEDEWRDRKVNFVVRECPDVLADPSLMRLVIMNLLSNALKFTRERPSAEIEVGSEIKDNETVFRVKDNGVGFDMRYAGKLFSPFQRLHRVEEYEGTGVGLAIVQRIIHRHGGRIWAESKPGSGTTFYFTLT